MLTVFLSRNVIRSYPNLRSADCRKGRRTSLSLNRRSWRKIAICLKFIAANGENFRELDCNAAALDAPERDQFWMLPRTRKVRQLLPEVPSVGCKGEHLPNCRYVIGN